MTDPTLETVAKFSDPSAWDAITENVPIFMEHEIWDRLDEKGNVLADPSGRPMGVAVLPGKQPPARTRLRYKVDAKTLQAIADGINEAYEHYAKPIKLFAGHSKPGASQEGQPPLVGFDVGATVGPWGPKGIKAVLTKRFIRKGMLALAEELPERSPEFHPVTNAITAVALLKTEPKLPMGMVTYAGDAVFYEQGFEHMAEQNDPTQPPDAEAMSDDEKRMADRIMKYAETSHPAFKAMCEKYAAENTPPDPGKTPPPGMEKPGEKPPDEMPEDKPEGKGPPEKKGEEEDDDMPKEKYEAIERRLASVEAENAKLREDYALSESRALVSKLVGEGFRIKEPKKLAEKLAKLTPELRKERADEIRENYAQEAKAPVGGEMVDVFDGHVEGGTVPVALDGAQTNLVVRYCEENNLDPEKDWEKAVKAVIK